MFVTRTCSVALTLAPLVSVAVSTTLWLWPSTASGGTWPLIRNCGGDCVPMCWKLSHDGSPLAVTCSASPLPSANTCDSGIVQAKLRLIVASCAAGAATSVGGRLAADTIVIVLSTVAPFASVARSVKLALPAVVGTPLRRTSPGALVFTDSHAGSVPTTLRASASPTSISRK